MQGPLLERVHLALGILALFGSAGAAHGQVPELPGTPIASRGVTIQVVANGLEDPRGLTFGPDDELYVAEAGSVQGIFVPPPPPVEADPPTRTRCWVYWPVGPDTPSYTGKVLRINKDGSASVMASGLPSFAANNLIGGDRMGAAAVAFAGHQLYTVVAGGGCSHGHPSDPNALERVYANGTTVAITDLSNYERSTVDTKPPTDSDFEPDGVWYSLIRAFGGFYTTEPNHGLLLRIENNGAISRTADLIAKVRQIDNDGDHTYSTLAKHRGALYLGTLGRINDDFKGAVYKISRDFATVQQVAKGLHGVLGVAFDRQDQMYVLETTAAGVTPAFSDPTAGRLVRVEKDGSLTPIVEHLTFPTALIAGPHGEFYVSNCGYHCDDRSAFPPTLTALKTGQILKVKIDESDSEFEEGKED